MIQWLRTLDRLLRGEVTRLPALRAGKLDIPVWGFAIVIDLLGLIYGLCMGVFALTPGGSHHGMQVLASMLKVPALFLLTLLVTFPSLYVFNALVGSRLSIPTVLRLLVAALAVMLAVLSSLGPILAFFSVTTTSYPFMVVLNVVLFSISGTLGLAFLLQTLHRMTVAAAFTPPAAPPVSQPIALGEDALAEVLPPPVLTAPAPPGLIDHAGDQLLGPHVKTVFRVWVIVFGLVGAQMAWVLRPFIGHPNVPFQWFRSPQSNFFQGVAGALMRLIA